MAKATSLTFDRDGYRCRECGKSGALECHHLIPLSEWPDQPWSIAGLVTLCRDCHLKDTPAHGVGSRPGVG